MRVVFLKLLSTVLKRIHTHLLVETSFINTVLSFYLAVISRGGYTDPMVDNTVFIKNNCIIFPKPLDKQWMAYYNKRAKWLIILRGAFYEKKRRILVWKDH